MHITLPLLVVTLVVWVIYSRATKRGQPLPPGPPGEPILGHLRVIPQDHPEYQYAQWGRDYKSDILSFNVLGRSIIVLNSIEVAHDLLDKRGSNYADRPRFVLFEVMGWGITLTFLRWSPRFQLHRKLLQQSFTQSACKSYRPIQLEEARRAVKAILIKSQNWTTFLRQFSTAVVLRIGFGIEVQEHDDPYVKMAINVEEATGEGGVPGSSIVDLFPIIRHLPSCCAVFDIFKPLAHARRTRASIQRLHDAPWDATELSIREGKAIFPSFMRTHFGHYLENEANNRPNEATIADLKGAAGAISIAGGNTTWSTIIVAILNLMLNPEIQAKAQGELDHVLGVDENGDILRLPTFEDREKLVYLEYIIHETTRWAPLSPVGVPHATVEDDTYKGYHIPKGSVVFANAWAMTHDEQYYSCPDQFNPSRYAPIVEGGKGEPYPKGPFGFGRRICPGQHLALAGVYILLATLLATMNLSCPVDKDGKKVEQKVTFTNGLSGVPDDFQCIMTPRSESSKGLLMQG